jgi:hypothetical protein
MVKMSYFAADQNQDIGAVSLPSLSLSAAPG